MNKKNQTDNQNRRQYSSEFKDQVLVRAEKDGVAQVAKDLDIKESLIYYWRSKKRLGGTTLENQKMQQMELARLRREKERLEMEVAFLKKAAAYFAKEQK
jgi:transposase